MLARLLRLVYAPFRHVAGGRGTPPVTSGKPTTAHDWHRRHKLNARITAARTDRAHRKAT